MFVRCYIKLKVQNGQREHRPRDDICMQPFVFQLSSTSWKVLGASHVTTGKAQYMGTNQIMCTLPDPKGSYVIRVKCNDDLWSPRVTLLNFDDPCLSCSFGNDQKCERKVRGIVFRHA